MLKELIQRLLDSRTTPAQAAHSCLPNSTSVNITPDPSGTGSYVPPQDGYITVTLKSGENSLISFWGSLNTSNTSYAGSNKVQPKVFMPVEKGRTIGYTYSGEFLSFVFTTMKGIGGGYNYLLQEVQLCLRAFSNSCLKLSSRVKESGLGTNPLRSKVMNLRLMKIRSVRTLPLMMAFSLLVPKLLICREKLQRSYSRPMAPIEMLCHSFLCLKGKVALIGIEAQNWLDSLRLLDLRNRLVGGLPC